MALLQIAEPGQSSAPHQHKLAAGIDLGTTNSLVASVRSGTASTLVDSQGRSILPSGTMVLMRLASAIPLVNKLKPIRTTL